MVIFKKFLEKFLSYYQKIKKLFFDRHLNFLIAIPFVFLADYLIEHNCSCVIVSGCYIIAIYLSIGYLGKEYVKTVKNNILSFLLSLFAYFANGISGLLSIKRLSEYYLFHDWFSLFSIALSFIIALLIISNLWVAIKPLIINNRPSLQLNEASRTIFLTFVSILLIDMIIYYSIGISYESLYHIYNIQDLANGSIDKVLLCIGIAASHSSIAPASWPSSFDVSIYIYINAMNTFLITFLLSSVLSLIQSCLSITNNNDSNSTNCNK